MKLPFKDGKLIDEFQLILSNKKLDKLNTIDNVYELSFTENYNSKQEASCVVYQDIDGYKCRTWDKLLDFAVVYLKETNTYYEIRVSIDETDVIKKTLTLTSLCEAELSGIKLYNIEINTESDIDRDDYTIPSVLYKENDPKNSILSRILDKAPHYHIGHVDTSLKNIQRSFSFDDKSIYDALIEIGEEINCIFEFDTTTRTINCYDLLAYCLDCGNREDMDGICPKCEGSNIVLPYGTDTGIFIDTINLAEQITVEEDSDNVFNTLKLKAGDELMTATIRSLNPNGTDYIYYFNQETLANMPKSLADKLSSYNDLVNEYSTNYLLNISDDNLASQYNALVYKYNSSSYAQYKYNEDNEKVLTNNNFLLITNTEKGYDSLIALYFNVIDFSLYLESSLMPTVIREAKTAKEDIANLTVDNLSPLALSQVRTSTNKSTVENALKIYSRLFTYSTYKITINTTSWDYVGDDGDTGFHYGEWIGTITLQSYTDEDDNATTDVLRIKVTDDYEKFLSQKIKKQMISSNESLGGIYDLMSIDISENISKFKEAIKYYSQERLNSFHDAYRSALDSLIEVDQATEQADFYEALYVPYYNRWLTIDEELKTRKSEIEIITNISNVIDSLKSEVQTALNFKDYLGEDDWLIFCSYRRESIFENSNYISTGLSNAELIDNANKFMKVAKKESVEAGTPQITITISMSNIFLRDEFKKLIDNFTVGNWIRAKCNNYVYKLRLTKIQIDTDSLDKCGVEFSSLRKKYNCLSDTQSILDNAKSISNSFSYISSQVDKSKKISDIIENWFERGLDGTLKIFNNADHQDVMFDENGLLVRSYDEIEDTYSPQQLKLINSSLAITDDNWKTVKTAIGKYYYVDPETGETKIAYGVNAETMIGRLIIGKALKLYSENGYNTSFFDDNGWDITAKPVNGKYSENIFTINKQETDGTKKKLFYLDGDGELIINTKQISLISDKANRIDEIVDLAGNGVSSIENEYYLSTSNTQLLGGEWQSTSPTWQEGYYIWTRIKTNYVSGAEPTYTEPVCLAGAKGDTGVGIKSIISLYALSQSNITPPEDGWSEECPKLEEGYYLWTKNHIEWDDGSSADTTPVLHKAFQGLREDIASLTVEQGKITSKVNSLESSIDNINISHYYVKLLNSATILNSENTTVTIECHVYNGTGDITKDQNDLQFQWYKNDVKYKTGNKITLTNADVSISDNFNCVFTIDSKTFESEYLTIIDETDTANLSNSYLDVSGAGAIQYLNNSGSYFPNWEETPLVITPCIMDNNVVVNLTNCTIDFKKSVDGQEVELSDNETVQNGVLTVNKNIMNENSNSLNYVCYITYKNSNIKLFKNIILNIAGSIGATGRGIVSIVNEFYLSDSKDEQTGGAWSTVQPSWVKGKYLWIREKITYENPTSVEYTTPKVDTTWEVINDVKDIQYSDTEPEDTTRMWFDTTNNLLKYWNEEAQVWVVSNDFANEINNVKQQITESYSSEIIQLKDSINSLVERLQTTTTDNTTSIERLASQIQQNADSIGFITTSVSEINNTLTGVTTKEEISKWARFKDGVLELGASDSPFAVKLSNTELGFYQSGSRIAYLSNQQLNISQAVVMKRINLGSFQIVCDETLGLLII